MLDPITIRSNPFDLNALALLMGAELSRAAFAMGVALASEEAQYEEAVTRFASGVREAIRPGEPTLTIPREMARRLATFLDGESYRRAQEASDSLRGGFTMTADAAMQMHRRAYRLMSDVKRALQSAAISEKQR